MTFLTKRQPYSFDSAFPSWLEFDRWDDYLNSGIEDRPLNKYLWDETDNEYKIFVVMPGIDKKDIDIQFKDETLKVKCDKSLSEKEKNFILNNTFAKVEIIDPVRGNDIFCTGKVSQDLR